jgi:serine/threonine-protein kinase
MAKTREGRYPTCQEFAHALQYQLAAPSRQFDHARDLGGHPTVAATPPPAGEPKSRSKAVLAVLAALAVLMVAGGVFAGVRLLSKEDKPPAAPAGPQTAAALATGDGFTGLYRADYGPGTDLEGNPIPGAPEMTGTWDVRSSCGTNGCIANARYVGNSGIVLVSDLTFDQIAGDWVAVATGSVQCNDMTTEAWVVFTLTPRPDGSLTGETTRAAANGCSSNKRTVTFTHTGDNDRSRVPDPSTLPARTTSPATALHGRYHESIVYTNGGFAPGAPDLQVRTHCLRTGDRCISLFHAIDGVVTLVFADNKWTRNEVGVVPCAQGGTTNVTITAEYPLPTDLADPIPVLNGRGQNISTGSQCQGGEFTDKFVRTGD